MPDATTTLPTPLETMREDFATHGCGSREEFDAIVGVVNAVIDARKPKVAAPEAKPVSASRKAGRPAAAKAKKHARR